MYRLILFFLFFLGSTATPVDDYFSRKMIKKSGIVVEDPCVNMMIDSWLLDSAR